MEKISQDLVISFLLIYVMLENVSMGCCKEYHIMPLEDLVFDP
jgi:hypothetical protein